MDDKAKLDQLWDVHQQAVGAGDARKKSHEQLAALLRPLAKYVVRPLILAAVAAMLALLGWLQYLFWGEIGMVPLGAVIAWPIDSDPPDGWHDCDGKVVDGPEELRTRMLRLYGNDNLPAGKIKLPDFGGRFLRGRGGASEAIGSPQGYSTALPGRRSVDLSHVIGTASDQRDLGTIKHDANSPSYITGPNTLKELLAWGEETRPDNYAVRWIMRIR